MPVVGESITEVQIGEWLKAEGEAVAVDDPVVVIETDKVTVELPAPAAGVIGRRLKQKGESAAVGEVIGYLEAGDGGAAGASKGAAGSKKSAQRTVAAPKEAPKQAPAAGQAEASHEARAPAATTQAPKDARAPAAATPAPKEAAAPAASGHVMPAARRVLAERGLEAGAVPGTGPGGRVTKQDAQQAPAPAAEPAAPAVPAAAPRPAAPRGERHEELVPMTPMRKRIAQRLVQAQRTAAILTTFNEIDMAAVLELRKEHQASFQERYGIKLGFMSFFIKAAIDALKLVPQVNGEIRDESIVYRDYYDIGVAVGGGKGLVVPVVRNAESLSFAELELAIADLSARAKDNKLALEELQGGTFTISNGGIYGSLLSTPILNPPQSGILGLHAIQERPVAREGQVVVRPMMYVALSYDHRLVDGREAVTFLKRIKDCVEAPARMLLEA